MELPLWEISSEVTPGALPHRCPFGWRGLRWLGGESPRGWTYMMQGILIPMRMSLPCYLIPPELSFSTPWVSPKCVNAIFSPSGFSNPTTTPPNSCFLPKSRDFGGWAVPFDKTAHKLTPECEGHEFPVTTYEWFGKVGSERWYFPKAMLLKYHEADGMKM